MGYSRQFGPGTMSVETGLSITPIHGDEVELRLGHHVAYGWVETRQGSIVSAGVEHSPDQESMDAVCALLDSLGDSDVLSLLLRGDEKP